MTVPKPPRKTGGRGSSTSGLPGRNIPWFAIGAGLVIVILVAAIAWVLVPAGKEQANLAKWEPTSSNPDPTDNIEGVVKQNYPAGLHVTEDQRVAYEQSPPLGGPHDQSWAVCSGVVYPNAVRTENLVHSLEHGAVWIAYQPDLPTAQVELLASKVRGQQYMVMSPYPGLDRPISLQSWGHQLKVDDATDERIGQFISATRLNARQGVYPDQPQATGYPEVGAACDNSYFDVENPPPFDASAPGPNAVPMDGTGAEHTADEGGSVPAPIPTGTP